MKVTDIDFRAEPSIFSNYSSITTWRLKVEMWSYFGSAFLYGTASLVFKINQLPLGGTCFTDLANGTAMYTFITVYCSNWYDLDGTVNNYVVSCKINKKLYKFFFIIKTY